MAESENHASETDASDAENVPEPSAAAASPESGADAAHEEYVDGTENPIEREHDEARSAETRSTTFIRPPGI